MTDKAISDEPGCPGGIKTREIAERAQAIALENTKAINDLRNRPPVWMTLLFSLLTFFLGCALTYGYVIGHVSATMTGK